jgi:hypothetical protein
MGASSIADSRCNVAALMRVQPSSKARNCPTHKLLSKLVWRPAQVHPLKAQSGANVSIEWIFLAIVMSRLFCRRGRRRPFE